MKYLLMAMSSFTLIFYSYTYIQESGELRHLISRSEDKLKTLSLYHATRLDHQTSQLVHLDRVDLCDSFEATPAKVSLFEDKKIKIYVSERPDMSFDRVLPFETGEFSIQDGALWVVTKNELSGSERKRTFPVLELSDFKNIRSVNLESEATSENCL